jgi:diguanylate cyclase (GGDEF)-like protein
MDSNVADSARDALTGVLGDAAVRAECTKAIEAAGGGELVALGYISFDGLRELNERSGNLVTDSLLREFGRRLREGTRECDQVGRFGRDEFLVVFRQLRNRLETMALVSRLRISLAEPIRSGKGTYQPIVNCGLAHPPADGSDVDALVGAAEKAMLVMRDQTREAAKREAIARVTTARTNLTNAAQAVTAAEQAVRDADAHLVDTKKLHAEAKQSVAAALEYAKSLGVSV